MEEKKQADVTIWVREDVGFTTEKTVKKNKTERLKGNTDKLDRKQKHNFLLWEKVDRKLDTGQKKGRKRRTKRRTSMKLHLALKVKTKK